MFRVGLQGEPDIAFQSVMDELDGGEWRWSEYTVIVDEASFLQRPQYLEPGLARLIRQAPQDILVIQTLHRPSETHPTVRGLATDLFFFHTYLERDLDVIAANYGPELSLAVSQLPQHYLIHWWLKSGGKPAWEIWNNPNDWKVSIGDRMANTSDEPVDPAAAPVDPAEAAAEPAAAAAEPAAGDDSDPVKELLRMRRQEISRLPV